MGIAHLANFGKQLTKSPKLYFYDTGLAAWLAGIRSADELMLSSLRGPLLRGLRLAGGLLAENASSQREMVVWCYGIGNDFPADHPKKYRAGGRDCGDGASIPPFWAMRKSNLPPISGGCPTDPTQGVDF